MPCHYDPPNISLEYGNVSLQPAVEHFGNKTLAPESFRQASSIVNNIIIPIIFSLGIVGNSVSLVVFGQKRLNNGVDPIERSATIGLITLAISDLLFCLVGFPAVFLNKYSSGTGQGTLVVVGFYYEVYRGALLNLFLFTSTWLVVLISAERFIGVCFPFKARGLIKVYRTLIAHCLVFVLSLIINLPLFFKWRIRLIQCFPMCFCYFRMPYWLLRHKAFEHVHLILWFIVGTFLPLFVLLFCNICILRAIYRSRGHVAGALDNEQEQQALSRITWTLLTIVLCYFLMVCPSMLLQFLTLDMLGIQFNAHYKSLAVVFTNLLQAIKFSSNFLLYCALHKRFREALGWKVSCMNKRQRIFRTTGESDTSQKKYQQVQAQVSNGLKLQETKDLAHL